MEPTGKYGHCALTDRWVLRAEMRGATVKIYQPDGTESRIRLRLSQEGMEQLIQQLLPLAWNNELKTAEELEQLGIAFDALHSDDNL
jgi:hypothetical protein